MEWYGSDKPDTRCAVRIQDVTGVFAGSEFGLFRAAADSQGASGCGRCSSPASRRRPTAASSWTSSRTLAKHLGAGGLPYAKWGKDGLASSFKKFLDPDRRPRCKAGPGRRRRRPGGVRGGQLDRRPPRCWAKSGCGWPGPWA